MTTSRMNRKTMSPADNPSFRKRIVMHPANVAAQAEAMNKFSPTLFPLGNINTPRIQQANHVTNETTSIV
ncbi:MAG: hypothetical protein WAN50_00700 [Minisyncoccia bacterium]